MKTPITISMPDEIALRELNLFWMSRSLGRWVIYGAQNETYIED